MGRSTAGRHSKGYYLAWSAITEACAGAALCMWISSGVAARRAAFGPEIPGTSWGAVLAAALVVTAGAAVLTVATSGIPRLLRWAVALAGAVTAGMVSPLALNLTVQPSGAGLLAAVSVAGIVIASAGAVRAPQFGKPRNPAIPPPPAKAPPARSGTGEPPSVG